MPRKSITHGRASERLAGQYAHAVEVARRKAIRASSGTRTTVRVPEDIEPEIGMLEAQGATRGAALQTLLRAGADALAQARADEEAARALAKALKASPREVPGLPSDSEIEAAMREAREE